jgi:hypothetical protein
VIVVERTAHIAAAAAVVVVATKDDSSPVRHSCGVMEDTVPQSDVMVGVVEDLHKTKGVNAMRDLVVPRGSVGMPKDRHEDAHGHDEQKVPNNEKVGGHSVGVDHRCTIPKPPPRPKLKGPAVVDELVDSYDNTKKK